jgi:hypothetical protein
MSTADREAGQCVYAVAAAACVLMVVSMFFA